MIKPDGSGNIHYQFIPIHSNPVACFVIIEHFNHMVRLALFLPLTMLFSAVGAQSWEEAQKTHAASLDLAWYTSRPFIEEVNGEMKGIEADMMLEFQEFLKERYQVQLTINWIEDVNFPGIMNRVKTSNQPNVFGISAFSITEERAREMKFTKPYLPDITVLVSSEGTPIVSTLEDIEDFMIDKVAVTIKSTTYEHMLFDLKNQLGATFKMEYIPSGDNILEAIAKADNRFGFIDLPIYLKLIQNGGSLTRQNFFTIRGDGYGIIMPLHSDWDVPFNEFLKDLKYGPRVEESISKYLGEELYRAIDEIYNSESLSTSILTKEKELQNQLIRNANQELEQEQSVKKYLIIGMIIILFFLIVVIVLYLKNRKSKRELSYQKRQIEKQQKAIAIKNEQLTNRNNQLISINEEKNNLVSILAHDMRSPLGQIIGLAGALKSQLENVDDDHMEMVGQIGKSAYRLNQMITKMLDENSLDKHEILHEPVYVSQLLEDIVKRYGLVSNKKNIEIELNPCSHQYIISTDHLLLLQVLENLMSNAVKFSPVNSKIVISAECKEEEVVFQIQDQGPGFTESDKQMMFARYQKLSAKPTAGESSTGLGLSIVKKYVEQLKGNLKLESEPNRGSCFFVTIPKS
ncbi:ATP-binding protein [Marinoscillum pacificum]|uniref:ATP-binding protein n=1 Tax=Marinoscillum pacificum TaxID=392723 RepID=UPI002157A6C9|nr:ATP-binding protein [Marinoscillum pacificum]